MRKQLSNKIRLFSTIALISGAAALAGGTYSYLTDFDNASNEFTVGKVDIDLEEPEWKPEENTSIEPSQDIKKDPQIKNTGKNPAYVYLDVRVPIQKLIVADANGNRQKAQDVELFSFSPDKNWTLMDSFTGDGYKTYRYSYNKILSPNQTSEALFKTMKFANVIEGQIDGQKLTVPVKAYAIQTKNTSGNTSDIPADAKTAFEKYYNQNKGQNGAAVEKAGN